MGEEEFCINELDDCEPSPEELDAIYTLLDKGGMIELNWKCSGKRAPSPIRKEESKPIETTEQNVKSSREMEFDFMDDVALPQMRQRNQTPKSTTKKKTTTNFAGVIDQLRKHGRLSTNPPGTPSSTSHPSSNATTTPSTPNNNNTSTTTTSGT